MKKDFLRFDDEAAEYRLILLHGWGADLEDLVPLARELIKAVNYKFELVALQAPQAHPDNLGRQWYPLFPADWESVPSAINDLQNRIRTLETNQISLSQTILLGFSQGGAMALGAGCNMPLFGIITCSAYPHPGWKVPSERPKVLMTHGTNDEIVPFQASNSLLNSLSKQEQSVELFEFEGGHEISPQAINRIKLTLNNWLI